VVYGAHTSTPHGSTAHAAAVVVAVALKIKMSPESKHNFTATTETI